MILEELKEDLKELHTDVYFVGFIGLIIGILIDGILHSETFTMTHIVGFAFILVGLIINLLHTERRYKNLKKLVE